MFMLRKSTFITATVLSVALSPMALGADLPQRPVTKAAPMMVAPAPSWTGCYVGGNIGAAWGRGDITNVTTGAGVSATNNGVAGGGQIGCDYQFAGGFVIGARDMFDATSLKGSAVFPITGNTGNSTTTWFNTLTARIGYAVVPNTLLYFQGGGAWTRANYNVTSSTGAQVAQFANNKGGYVVGGGAEWMFAPHWSTFLEYNYMNFGSSTAIGADGNTYSSKKDSQNLLVGLNYRF